MSFSIPISRRDLLKSSVFGVGLGWFTCFQTRLWNGQAMAIEIELKDGRRLAGSMAPLSSVAAKVDSASEKVETIRVIDDRLRRTYLPKTQIVNAGEEAVTESLEVFQLKQRVVTGDSGLALIGTVLKAEPFDQFGRRTVTLANADKPLEVIQAITRIDPHWTRVQGVNIGWDMRVATTNFPTDQLMSILLQTVVNDNADHYKRVARFFIQCDRYEAAVQVLEKLISAQKDEKSRNQMREELTPIMTSIRQLAGDYLFSELKFRKAAGQHQLVAEVLAKFPADGASPRTLTEVREMVRLSEQQQQAIQEIPELLQKCIDEIPEERVREQYAELYEEVKRELRPELIERLAAFRTLGQSSDVPAEEKLALAMTGWLIGAKMASRSRTMAISLLRIRKEILRYLREENDLARSLLVPEWLSEEGASVSNVTAILTHMKPPFADVLSDPVEQGEYHLEVKTSLGTVRYRVQLPSEYNALRRYPTILVLHGERSDAGKELDWWAGTRRATGGERMGQASRRGYIVIAPEWMNKDQTAYGYSAREHSAILSSLRDACRHFAVDTDHVFLAGHSLGGDAAWDIGVAHPDLWAGVIPITARSEMYADFIYQNAIYVPLYFVCGEMDPQRTIPDNSKNWDRMLNRRLCNITIVEYIGRGHEDFSDEIHRLYEWMELQKRNFFPEEFNVKMMRPWDNFFWWVELRGVPSSLLVEPVEWKMKKVVRPAEIKAKVSSKKDSLYVQSPADEVILRCSPELLNLDDRVEIRLNGRDVPIQRLTPSIEVLLEDARTRCDLQHPFSVQLSSLYKAPKK